MKYIIFVLLGAALSSFFAYENDLVSGTVKDASDGTPISGVNVTWKGTSIGTSTDANGNFSLKKHPGASVLVFSFVGYDTKEVAIGDDGKPVNIRLAATVREMKEVVVTGFGVVRELQGRVAGAASIKKKPHNRRHERQYNSNRHQEFNTEDYSEIVENSFHEVAEEPLSTFSIDVDGASYSNTRRFLNSNQLPPAGAVRIEEFVNYFHYTYPQPKNEDPFSINTEMGGCPWNEQHKLVMIGLQGKKILAETLPPGNLVFLVDVSGSMQDENKLPLVKSSLKLLTEQLREEDKISIVVYAGNAGLVLSPTSGANKHKINDAINELEAGGSTAGGAGIRLAYKVAKYNFMKDGNNRVILCTDGDFNVGVSSDAELVSIIEEERKSGVFLTVLGYGMGNYKDNKMQQLANKGNGNHSYIDNISEAKKVLVNEFGGTLFTIAKDVKLQIEFNPARVSAYRLIGYENRMLKKEDFNNDEKDAGEIGSGHTVTALYEIIPAGVKSKFIKKVDPLKYQQRHQTVNGGNDLVTVKFRYKKPGENKSRLLEHVIADRIENNASDNFKFAAAVAQFGMLLTNSAFKQASSFENVLSLAKGSLGDDREGYRKEFLKLVRVAQGLNDTSRK